MSLEIKQFYEFGPYRLDAARRLLLREGKVVPLTHKAFETLALLVKNSGRVVDKDELMKEVWPDAFVEEGSLARNISVLRKTLGESPSDHQYIETVPKRGYRFVASVSEAPDPAASIEADAAASNGGNAPAEVAPAASAQARPGEAGRKNRSARAALMLAAMLIAAACISYGLHRLIAGNNLEASISRMTVTRFTTTGKSIDAAISRDGKYVVHVIDDGGQQSLWIKQVATGSNVQIAPPADVSYQGLTFSHDSNYVYYNLWDKKGVGVIHRVPVLGGVSTRIITDVMPTLAVSPDGKRIAFIRGYAAEKAQALMVADADGADERRLVTRKGSAWYMQPAWSPDGKTIVCVAGSAGSKGVSTLNLVEVPVSGGSEKPITSRDWLGMGGVAWLGDGAGLLVAATDQAQSPLQIWSISYPKGEAHKITNDVNGYFGLSLTADGATLVTVQDDVQSNIWVTTGGDASGAKRITSGKYEGFSFAWADQGRIVYRSWESGSSDLWIMDQDGSNKKQLTADTSEDFEPTVTADGRHIVFVSNRTGTFHLWRMDQDGTNLKQLTGGSGEWSPYCSPTGDGVIYVSSAAGKQNLWKIPVEGGEPVRLTSKYSYAPAISPDGKHIAYSYWDEEAKPQKWGREIIPLNGAEKGKPFEVPLSAFRSMGAICFKWAPDGRALTYVDHRGGVSNVWSLPLDGGPPRQLTNFIDGRIFCFDWSRDGKQLACSRGAVTSDVVLIGNIAGAYDGGR